MTVEAVMVWKKAGISSSLGPASGLSYRSAGKPPQKREDVSFAAVKRLRKDGNE
jgi:hypothetical protein